MLKTSFCTILQCMLAATTCNSCIHKKDPVHLHYSLPLNEAAVVMQQFLQDGFGAQARSELESGCASRGSPHLLAESGHPIRHR